MSPEESRAAALGAARALLLEQGPQGVTLTAVAAKIGRTHANLLHHFGSAAGLQGELAKSIADSVNASIAEPGAGALAAWMIITGNRDALNPILDSIRGLVSQLAVGHDAHHVAESTLSLVLNALGDSLLGPPIAEALGLPRDAARELAAQRLRHRLEIEHHGG